MQFKSGDMENYTAMIYIVSFIIAFLILVAFTYLFGKKGNYRNDGTEV